MEQKEIQEPIKYCKGCDQNLPRSYFNKNGITVHPTCRTCRSKERAAVRYPRKEGIKYCPGCKVEHSTTDYDTDKSQPDGLQSNCKEYKKKLRLKYLCTYDGFTRNLFKDLKSNAKKRDIQVNITLDDIKQLYIKQNGKCAITGKQMTYQAVERGNNNQHILNKWNISVDRTNSSKGYTLDNIRLVCAIVNRLKFNASDDDFLLLCGTIAQRNFNHINKTAISNIDEQFIDQYPTNKLYSLITDLLDQESEKQSNNIKTDTPMQKWICSFNGYIKKTYLDIKNNLDKRSKKLKFDITEDDIKQLYIKQEGRCLLSGIKMTYIGYQSNSSNKINPFNISIDRIDSSKGYTKDNIQLICSAVNRMKSDLTDDELLLLSNDIYRTNFNKINNLIISKIKST
ncbi:hypothetical protein QKU48_gp0879 [Fadolivirus algeromassiliense]|jgi:hypothetical protein|uniref:Uncharacterized protein n=1 Tax=Fadolivirus FV1/VV64 TaxID=3070911 RepID=A0A7D3V904_9VIRU|nr:hypothetical protein QKU48_gp0879 [Fadolivirus algeromassiliense]QKF94337.1 hypothetical protein Fadolivirus_1_879 [Fadolivirus FV1/VV64]